MEKRDVDGLFEDVWEEIRMEKLIDGNWVACLMHDPGKVWWELALGSIYEFPDGSGIEYSGTVKKRDRGVLCLEEPCDYHTDNQELWIGEYGYLNVIRRYRVERAHNGDVWLYDLGKTDEVFFEDFTRLRLRRSYRALQNAIIATMGRFKKSV